MQFREKIKELREQHEMTQRQLAVLLEIDVALYNRFEKGRLKMRREMVEKLAGIYNLPSDELIKYWLAGQVYSILMEEELAGEAISIVAEDITECGYISTKHRVTD